MAMMMGMQMTAHGHAMMPHAVPHPHMMHPHMMAQSMMLSPAMMGRGARRSAPMRPPGPGRPAIHPAAYQQPDGHESDGSGSGSTSSSSSDSSSSSWKPPAPKVPVDTEPIPTGQPASNWASRDSVAVPQAVTDVPVPVLQPQPSSPQSHQFVAPQTPPDTALPRESPQASQVASSVVLPSAAPPPVGAAPSPTAALGDPNETNNDDDLPLPRPRPPPKPGKISFNMQGAKKAIAEAQAQVQVEEAVAAARARRLNTRDAATQTVRDPETQDGDIVTIWRLRPRGMESFPHFPRQSRKAAYDSAITAGAEEEDSFPALSLKPVADERRRNKKRSRQLDIERISDSPERPDQTSVQDDGDRNAPVKIVAATEESEPQPSNVGPEMATAVPGLA